MTFHATFLSSGGKNITVQLKMYYYSVIKQSDLTIEGRASETF